ncbi:aldehyde dehydrogenase family protein [Rhodococcus sp. JS3073]|uniref:aldehyde dehydrogenase family protein n=1 Tax=Rhodococcus sp. JS3073 TaxID=3002901 RepID=UPI0022863D45|nr:aldehyde dehydrogenase family protein [Rhodococcus sp. JS3073]WAM19648.1 aldehyde dehydrogenase family protein [Rhodococcus sp. JS3073]
MSAHRTRIYVHGQWVQPISGSTTTVTNPATLEPVGTVPCVLEPDVDLAVAAARSAFESWSRTPVADRTAVLRRVTGLLREAAQEMAEVITLEMGAPADFARSEHVDLPLTIMDDYLDELSSNAHLFQSTLDNSLVVREPVGVVAAITPWNFPLYQLVIKVFPALAAGCTVVAKPSELTPLSTYRFTDILHAAGLPAGVFNLVPGKGSVVGAHLASHPDVDLVSFTGSTNAGVAVSTAAAPTVKRVALELGGKSAAVILPGADLAAAVEGTVTSCFWNTGQTCSALTRLVVPRAQHDDAIAVAVQTAQTLAVDMGPVISADQFASVQELISSGIAEGAELACGGPGRPPGRDEGYFVRPTVFGNVSNKMRIAQEEIFGPVLTVIPYDTVSEAVDIANDSPYGLSGAVWGPDNETALDIARRLRTGQVDINGGPFNPKAPFGGMKQSGVGRELGVFGLEEYLELKSIQFPL